MPPGGGVVGALPEAAVQLAPDDPELVGLVKLAGHGLPELVDLGPHQRVDVRIGRVLERRHEDACVGVAHLVGIEIHLGEPVPIEHLVEVLRLDLREHVAVTVVIVTCVLVVQVGQRRSFVRGAEIAPIPLDHHALPVRVLRGDEQHDGVLEKVLDLGCAFDGQPVDQVVHGLARPDLGGVHVGTDEDHRLAGAGNLIGTLGRRSARVGQLLLHRLIARQVVDRVGGGDRDEQVGVTQGRLSQLGHLHAIRPLVDE